MCRARIQYDRTRSHHSVRYQTSGVMSRALELLEKIEENVSVCCAITMSPEEVLELIDELRELLENE